MSPSASVPCDQNANAEIDRDTWAYMSGREEVSWAFSSSPFQKEKHTVMVRLTHTKWIESKEQIRGSAASTKEMGKFGSVDHPSQTPPASESFIQSM